ncbi:MAG TPA: HIT family protein [Candidatus Saccharimonadales bacterium]|nr:HIT family protein [Candidatus Saccharimonadales bacterium]
MCIFCKIVAGELPAYKVYEDDKVLAFLNIKPTSIGHTLVVAKAHYANLEEISEADLTALILATKKVGYLLKNKLGVLGYNMSSNNDPVAGQEIPHIHFHLIPRHEDDGLTPWPKIECSPGDMEEITKKLTS